MLRWAEEVSLFFYGSCTAARTTAEGGALDNFRPDPAIRPPGSGSYEWDLRIGRWQMSAELRSVYGLSQAPGHPEELLQIVHPDDRDHVRSEMARARKATSSYEYDFRILCGDGSVRSILDRGVVRREGGGEVTHLCGLQVDVTDLIARTVVRDPANPADTLKAVDDTDSRIGVGDVLDVLFDDAPVGLAIWDRDLRFVRINALLAEMNGLSPEAHLGKTVQELLPDVRDIEGLNAVFREILETGEAHRDVEVSGTTPAAPGEARYWREHFFPIRTDGEIVGVAATVEDVTEARHAQEQIDVLLHELNHRSKNLVALILAISRQTARHQPEDFLEVFQSRLEAMSAAQDLLIRRNEDAVSMQELIRSQLPHFAQLIGDRILLQGDPDIVVPGNAVQGLGLAFHELTTNAVKYGALSNHGGSRSAGPSVPQPTCFASSGRSTAAPSRHHRPGPASAAA